MAEQLDPHQDTDKWEVEYLRATTFISPQDIDEIIEYAWWEKTIGSKPKEDHINYQQRVREQKGMLDNNRLIMLSQLDRIDWTVMIEKQDSDKPLGIPTIGSLSDALESFLRVVKKWLDVGPTMNRLALGAVLIRPVTDIQTGYKEILRFLPDLRLDHAGISNFSYQINRPRESTSSVGIKINRLSKWSVMQTGTLEIRMNASETPTSMSKQGQSACRLGLDINTAPPNKDISKDDVWPIFEELVRCGREIAREGDIQ